MKTLIVFACIYITVNSYAEHRSLEEIKEELGIIVKFLLKLKIICMFSIFQL
jgi:hypothetical protein